MSGKTEIPKSAKKITLEEEYYGPVTLPRVKAYGPVIEYAGRKMREELIHKPGMYHGKGTLSHGRGAFDTWLPGSSEGDIKPFKYWKRILIKKEEAVVHHVTGARPEETCTIREYVSPRTCGSLTMSMSVVEGPPGWESALVWHNNEQAIAIIDGKGWFEVMGEKRWMDTGDWVFVPLRCSHRQGAGEEGVKYVLFGGPFFQPYGTPLRKEELPQAKYWKKIFLKPKDSVQLFRKDGIEFAGGIEVPSDNRHFISPYSCGCLTFHAGWKTRFSGHRRKVHMHNAEEPRYIVSGKGWFEIDGQKYEAGPGDATFTPARAKHSSGSGDDLTTINALGPLFRGYWGPLENEVDWRQWTEIEE